VLGIGAGLGLPAVKPGPSPAMPARRGQPAFRPAAGRNSTFDLHCG
jgi:hypothetical protein